ncbi:MAG: glycosyltransferase family 4 protein [Phycisphaerales bacterium]
MSDRTPVFGMIYFGGSLSGALVRDMRLANELAERGYRVVVWWAMDKPDHPPLDQRIEQHLLFNGFRYFGRRWRGVWGLVGKMLQLMWSGARRERASQKRPRILEKIMRNWMRLVAEGVENDAGVIDRFVEQLQQAGVTHLLPMLSVLGEYGLAAQRRMGEGLSGQVKQLITYQGYELYVNYARMVSVETERTVMGKLREVAERSPWNAIAVSEDYADRVSADLGLARERLTAIPPGVPTRVTMSRDEAERYLREKLSIPADLAVVTYLGRQDTEKGIDLLLYATNILRREGVKVQLVIAGPTLFGRAYRRVMRQIATDLRLGVPWLEHVDERMREALFAGSRCVVYPSIHREPFGMVPVEAGAYGTPSVVPNFGGVGQAIEVAGRRCGLHFHAFDSGDLARQIRRLIEDESLWKELSANGPIVAEYHSVANLADRVLKHMGLANQRIFTTENTEFTEKNRVPE